MYLRIMYQDLDISFADGKGDLFYILGMKPKILSWSGVTILYIDNPNKRQVGREHITP